MNEPTHTPGPWRFASVSGGFYGVIEGANPATPICKLGLNNPANANLIAAAPELLESCCEVAEFLGQAIEGVIVHKDDVLQILPKLEAAIRKAEGK